MERMVKFTLNDIDMNKDKKEIIKNWAHINTGRKYC